MAASVNLREIVLDLLIEVNEKNEYSHIALSAALNKYAYLEKNYRSFITRTFEGCLERRIELDYIVNQYSKIKTDKMKPLIRNLLRMGVYQIMYMDNVPESAACNESVKLAKKRGFASLTGFVNGVLRAVSRNKASVRYPLYEESPYEYCSVKYSMPQWIIGLWEEQLGMEKTVELLESFRSERKTFIRCNTLKCTMKQLQESLVAEHVAVKPVKGIDFAYEIEDYDSIGGLASFQNGMFYVQDVSSMLAGVAASVTEGMYVVDMCSAPGGKAMNVYMLMNGKGRVTACDLTGYKVGLIQDNVDRLGLSGITPTVWDSTVLNEELEESADLVIADVPCSGLGVLSRKNDIRYKITKESIEELIVLQRKILGNAAKYLKTGGTLIFSTCTINRRENEENVAWIIENTGLEPEALKLFGILGDDFADQSEWKNYVQIFPKDLGGDGFFIAKFKKR